MTGVQPDVCEGDDAKCPHMMWANWGDDEDGVDAHVGFWRTSDGRIALQSIQANRDVRGRDMVRWLGHFGLPIHVVEAIPEAYGFWERMTAEGLVEDWEVATGWPSDLERIAVPFPEALMPLTHPD